MSHEPTPTRTPAEDASGMALVLVLIFTVLIYVLVAELVTTAQMARLTGENDGVLRRMQDHMIWSQTEIEQTLKDDLAAGAAASEEGGGALPGGAAGGAAAGGGEEEGNSDSSQDSWFEPTSFSEGDLTTYVFVEDENRKFNVLTLISPDDDFARASRERFARLIDAMREDTQFDLTQGDGEQLADQLIEWMRGRNRNDQIPRPPLKSDETKRPDVTLPLHLDELLMLRSVTEDIYFDRVEDKKLLLGLESVLTIYTSLKVDPGDPEKLARQQLQQRTNRPAASTSPQSPQPGGGTTPPPAQPGASGETTPEQPLGVGIRININTAHRCVLRALSPPNEIPDAVIDAILRYRNEEEPPEEGEEGAEGAAGAGAPADDYSGDISEGQTVKKKIFKSLDDLEQIPEWKNLADVEAKTKFTKLLTVESHVFSIHMASMLKRNEQTRSFVLRRTRSVMVRLEGEEEAKLHPLILLEDRNGLRIFPIDLPEQQGEELAARLIDMDYFTRQERDWNPFFLEFYLPQEELNLPQSRSR